MSSRWYTSQTINDDLVLLLYDDYFVFVIILRAKALSLVTNDEPVHFVIECSHSVMKLVIVTSESSLMNTFLVVPSALGMREHQYAGTPVGDSARRPPPAKGQVNKQHRDRQDAKQEQQSECRHGGHR